MRAQTNPTWRQEASVAPDSDISYLSNWVGTLQQLLIEKLGVGKVYIGGGSARSFLDYICFGTELAIRDLDMMAVVDQSATPEMASEFMRECERQGLGLSTGRGVKPKKRANPRFTDARRLTYVAGYGFHVRRAFGPIMSVSLFHRGEDLALNGLLDIDRVFLPLLHSETLEHYLRNRVAAHGYDELASKRVIHDVENGYVAWVNRSARVVNWAELEKSSSGLILRLIRSFAKMGDFNLAWGPKANPGAGPLGREEYLRDLLKLLGDESFATELKAAGNLGALRLLSPSVEEEVRKRSVQEIARELDGHHQGVSMSAPSVARRMFAVCDWAAEEDRLPPEKILSLYRTVYEPDLGPEAVIQ